MTCETYRLGHLGTFSQSGIDKKSNDDEIPVKIVNYMDVFGNKRGVLHGEEFQEVTAPKGKFPYHLLRRGDVLITPSSETSDDIGHSAVVSEDMTQTAYSYHLVRFRPFRATKIIPEFSRFAFQARQVRAHLERMSKGTTRKILTRNDFTTIPFVLPDLPTQHAIADFLDRETARIDSLIDKKQRLVALLGQKLSESVRQSVSWGLDASVPRKPSRVPAGDDLAGHWSEQRLSTICRFVQGKAHEPFIEDDGDYVCVTARFVSTNGERFRRCTHNLTPGKINDIAMVMSDLPNGRALARAFLVDQDNVYAINQRVCLISVMEGDPRFFYYQLDRNFQLLRYNDGFNQTHLPNRAFTQLFLKVPPVDEQKRIADYLDALTKHTKAVTEKTSVSMNHLRQYRSAIITAAVTGQIDVAEWSKAGTNERQLDAIQAEFQA